MTANTPNRAYTYPQSTDDPDVAADMQELATDIDTDVQGLATRLTALDNGTAGMPIVHLTQQSAQVLTSGTAAALTFGTSSEIIDTHNYHSEVTNNSRVTPLKAGYYEVTVFVSMATGATNYTQISAACAKNGTRDDPADVRRPDAGTSACTASATRIFPISGSGDYVEGYATQNSGGNNSTSTTAGFRSTLQVKWLRPL